MFNDLAKAFKLWPEPADPVEPIRSAPDKGD